MTNLLLIFLAYLNNYYIAEAFAVSLINVIIFVFNKYNDNSELFTLILTEYLKFRMRLIINGNGLSHMESMQTNQNIIGQHNPMDYIKITVCGLSSRFRPLLTFQYE